jgi:hypothetical protein
MKKTAREREVALSQSALHRLVLYHPTTGEFTRTDGSYLHQSMRHGYVIVYTPGKGQFSAHRLAFLFMEGSWPEHAVDHIDGIKSNNRWSNLRRATKQQNEQNIKKPYKNNSTGVLGVSFWGSNPNKFEARISFNGVKVHIGVFDSKEAAHEAYVKVKRELHPFGEL